MYMALLWKPDNHTVATDYILPYISKYEYEDMCMLFF